MAQYMYLRPHAGVNGAHDEARRRAVDIVVMLQQHQQQQEAQPDDDANLGMGQPATSFDTRGETNMVRRDLAPNDKLGAEGSPLARAVGQRAPTSAPSGDIPEYETSSTRLSTTYPVDLPDVDQLKTSATLDALISDYDSMHGSDPPAHHHPLDLAAPPPAGPKQHTVRTEVSMEFISEADPLFVITMRGSLEVSNLTEYADAFEAHGWDDDHARFLAQLEPSVLREELEQMAKIVRMNKGHASRLITCMISLLTDAPDSEHDTDADTYTSPAAPRAHLTGVCAFHERSIRHNITSAKRTHPDVSRRSIDLAVGRKRTSSGMYAAPGHYYAMPPAPTRMRPPCSPGASSSGATGAAISVPTAVDDDASGLSAKAKAKRKILV